MESKWMLYTKRAEFEELSARFNISPVLARIIINRDIKEEDFSIYLKNDLKLMHDVKRLNGIDEAKDVIMDEINAGRKIRVVGDYDIDGVCSSYILVSALKYFGANVDVKIPDRIKDGYGINDNIIKDAAKDGISMIITCDNGIAAHSQMELAKELGIKVVITDHHDVYRKDGKDFLPVAEVVINPKRSDCDYPFKNICGGLVAYKLMEYIYESLNAGKKLYDDSQLSDLLEVAAIATVGDVMPLIDENRILVKNGLKSLMHTKNIGLKALIRVTGMEDKRLSAYSIGFVLGPCLNAGGRLENALIALNMFMAEDEEDALKYATHLKELNDERKDLTVQNVKKAIENAENEYSEDDILVIYLENCHESIAGIIAGRVREALGKPTIILTDAFGEENMLKGSGRSIENYNMFEALYEVKDIFTKFGGHPMAAGMSLEKGRLDEFRKRLNMNSKLCAEDFIQKIWIDIALPFSYLSLDFVRELDKLEPFGNKNEKPKFARKDIKIISKNILGKNKNVVKMTLEDIDGTRVDGIYFGDGEAFFEDIGDRKEMDIIYYPDINEYGGRESLQIIISDYR
ncbi:single-stranded-DNA-specific exonuclease RecJ [Lachnoanaerobaculum umeaense]|uniref:Single-stranded-DNA-specific exonuclease RecJ n=1 Tax=Lachnoanaerobaculum umeaense TaxID=617123 RepID=A0A385Q1H7_9FIRM|nr:single-stranded-DNA-specific exonuclease RecJ [Lachnoanaerobaculum umeaense]AYB00262.1 single-stranded-DNA-specific exonuclease RecJ [Lachnoanaerobaculum umeaense]PZW96696.1 single-stranded-DNA-specific exonuclease [Lachnoanaerobaculum umeaense]